MQFASYKRFFSPLSQFFLNEVFYVFEFFFPVDMTLLMPYPK